MKRVRYVTNVKFVPANQAFKNHEDMDGKFCLHCQIVIDTVTPHMVDQYVTTSPVIQVDVNSSTFETQKTNYVVIAESEIDTYKMIFST